MLNINEPITPEELMVIASQPVYEQQGIYICMDCGKLNTYWVDLCEDCDTKSDMQQMEEQQNG